MKTQLIDFIKMGFTLLKKLVVAEVSALLVINFPLVEAQTQGSCYATMSCG